MLLPIVLEQNMVLPRSGMPEDMMVGNRRVAKRLLVATLGVMLAVAGATQSTPAHAQYAPVCPPGYYYYPAYGCVPPGYFYGPPYYVYPDFGFGFFYGPGWGRGWRGGPAFRGGLPGGGGFHGGGGRR